MLNILKISLQGSAAKTRTNETAQERETERYHTYGSLLNRLRDILEDAGLIRRPTTPEQWRCVNSSEFVEIRGRFVPNPLVASLRMVTRIVSIAKLLGGFQSATKGKHQGQQEHLQKRQFDSYQEVFTGLMNDLGADSVQTFVVEVTEPTEHRVVVSLLP